MAVPFVQPVLACGAHLKNTFCLGKERHAFMSHHIGDLENYETLNSFVNGIEHFKNLFAVEPSVVVHDLHPEYLSTKYAIGVNGLTKIGVQHHHAHIASCMAEHGLEGPVIGVAFDGLATAGTVRFGAVNFWWQDSPAMSAARICALSLWPAAIERFVNPGEWR